MTARWIRWFIVFSVAAVGFFVALAYLNRLPLSLWWGRLLGDVSGWVTVVISFIWAALLLGGLFALYITVKSVVVVIELACDTRHARGFVDRAQHERTVSFPPRLLRRLKAVGLGPQRDAVGELFAAIRTSNIVMDGHMVAEVLPYIGLLGTVTGLAAAHDLLGAANGDAAVATVIGHALRTTIAGLIAAVPAFIATWQLRKQGLRAAHYIDRAAQLFVDRRRDVTGSVTVKEAGDKEALCEERNLARVV